MLDNSFKSQLKDIFKNLKSNFTFKIHTSINHPNGKELLELLEEVASCSDKINCDITESNDLSFKVLKEGEKDSNINFRMIPNGHEFTTLLMVILNKDGIGKNLPDDLTINRIKALKGEINLKSYISLTCTNCPDVVQALNIMAIYNPNIHHELIDGGINQKEIEALNIQAVPSVYANDKSLHIGRSTLGELLNKIEKQLGTEFKIEKTTKKDYDVVVVGGGPAGVSSAIYSARKGFSVAIVAENIGGQVAETIGIENMISLVQTTGKELSTNLRSHLTDYPIDLLENRKVIKTEVIDGYKHIHTSSGEELITPALIIATGASWRRLNVEGEEQYMGAGVAFCTHCDGPFYKGKKVVVVGGGNSGLEAAIDLASMATEVTVLEFMDEIKGDKILQDKLATFNNVKIILSAETKEIIGNGNKVIGLQYKNRLNEELINVDIDGVFVQIGLTANSDVFKEIVETNRMKEIEIDAHCRTKTPGVYAAGDVSVVPYKQIVIAMGEGAKAALTAFDDSIKGKLLFS